MIKDFRVKSLHEGNFEKEIGRTTWLIHFWAAWCGPCTDVTHLEQFEVRHPGVEIAQVNVEENPDLAAAYSITVVPTYIFFKGGKPVRRLTGVQTKEELHKAVESI